jgi:S1-C subfamily serine protease
MTSTASASGTSGVLPALSDELANAVERAGRVVVAIHARRRIPASGIHWRDGVIVAAHHTLHRDEDITVTLGDGRTIPARLAGRDPSTDLAVLRVDSSGTPVADIADASALRVGALVLALGRPGPLVTASLGVLSAVSGEWRTWHGGQIDHLVRPDVAIYDGFSGGPLIDGRGRVLGLNTSGLSRGSALTIPSSTVGRVVDLLLTEGRVTRGYVGLGLQPVRLPAPLVSQLGLERDTGLMVISVENGGPADRGGLMLGDVLLSWSGTPVDDPSDLLAMLGPGTVGKRATARVVRAGALSSIEVTIGERPSGRGRR